MRARAASLQTNTRDVIIVQALDEVRHACDDRAMVQSRIGAFRHMIEKLTFSVPLLTVRCCAGATFKREGDDFHSMFARADRALYVAKHEGKDRFSMEDEPS